MDTAFLINRLIFAAIEIFVFMLSIMIYKNTKGASLAYKKWAESMFVLLVAASIYITGIIAFGCSESGTTDKNELYVLIAGTLDVLAYFYIPVGVMYLSKDMGFGSVNEELIKKIQILFYCIIFSLSIIFIAILPFFKIRRLMGAIFNLLFTIVWISAIYYYNNVYKYLKTTNNCWLFLYLALIFSFASSTSAVIYFATYVELFSLLTTLFGVGMALGYITGFFKLAKMVEAI